MSYDFTTLGAVGHSSGNTGLGSYGTRPQETAAYGYDGAENLRTRALWERVHGDV